MPTVINGTTYYRFGRATWLERLADGSLRLLANASLTLYADEARTPISVLTTAGTPWTPTINADGQSDEFLAPQLDVVFGDAGKGLQPILTTEYAEVIAALAARVAASETAGAIR